MPATDFQETSSSSSPSFGFSILSRRRDQIHSMGSPNQSTGHGDELEAFQRQVAKHFQELLTADSGEILSIKWLQNLLDTFLCCQEEFKVILFNNKVCLNKPPMDKYVSDYYERSVKALDVCNAIRDGIDQIRQWQKSLEIVLCSFDNQRSIGEGHFRRAKKALADLAIGMLDDKGSNNVLGHRNRSFGRNNLQKEHKSLGHYRSLSWSVSRTWSASKQLQAISGNLVVPRNNETISTNGLNLAVFTMSYVLLFVMWALVAAIPCQDRGLQTHFNVSKQFLWAGPILLLHERILEESKKRDRRSACGLLREIHEIENCARKMNELADCVKFPLTEEKEREVKQRVEEVGLVYEGIKDGLDPLERRVREVFRRIVRSRMEGLDCISR
ncbi:hypothetical protein BUALT_Bualt01G0018200 [Buddleja alternifolia]|uniref:Uncharacterized protein n=1 Tax=Buddleja alternifolia TaxID=168488 RepID=A0AAV6YEP4_9LAMI|nr:hypothetical protein BUALT_Bualt01G0018200 [Buddleja alternifolia]